MPFSQEDTIVAVATPPGRSALGLVRLSGPQAVTIADQVFRASGRQTLLSAPSHTLLHGFVYDADRVVDEVMAVALRAPRSFTGEDIVEISGHGSPVTLAAIVHLLLAKGARLAAPGEFTFRAFSNGKMDLAQADAVCDLIEAKTALAAHTAMAQLSGTLSARILSFRRGLIDLLSHIEVALDYAEEEIPSISDETLATTLRGLATAIEKLRQTADKGRFLRDGLKAAIVGRPNAGKSSLLNALLERERAIVTDIPGTTRDTLEETLDMRGIPVVIIDTAGLRAHTADAVEKIGQERTKAALRTADVVLWLIDASAPLAAEDRIIAGLLKEYGKEAATIVLCNKSDQPPRMDPAEFAALFPAATPLAISALTRAGIEVLEEAIIALATITEMPESTPVVNLRHRDALGRVHAAITETLGALTAGATEEIIAFHLREALNTLGEITGETTTEEILENIFSRFCVGK
jgi:tRNA modification GTPase